VADHQLDKSLGEQQVTPDAYALPPEFMEIDDGPDDIFIFVYDDVAS
jgi:hypothetical protein